MKFDEAVKILRQVCSVYKGTLQEHEVMLKALEVVSKKEDKKKK